MEFPYMLARDNETVCVNVTAVIHPAEHAVGIMVAFVEDVLIRDNSNSPVQVTDAEYDAIMKDAQERLDNGTAHYAELDDIL